MLVLPLISQSGASTSARRLMKGMCASQVVGRSPDSTCVKSLRASRGELICRTATARSKVRLTKTCSGTAASTRRVCTSMGGWSPVMSGAGRVTSGSLHVNDGFGLHLVREAAIHFGNIGSGRSRVIQQSRAHHAQWIVLQDHNPAIAPHAAHRLPTNQATPRKPAVRTGSPQSDRTRT